MRRSVILFAAAFLFTSVAAAQNDSPAPAPLYVPAPSIAAASAAAPEDPAPQMVSSVRDDFPWQLSLGYQYTYFDFRHTKASMNGANTTLVRFLNDHLAVEGSAAVVFGAFNSVTYGRIILYDGGARWTFHRHKSKWEPWVHGDAGGMHLRETAGAGPFSFNGFALIAGGGVDYSFHHRFSIRMQGDYMATHIASAWQNSISAGVGFVVNF